MLVACTGEISTEDDAAIPQSEEETISENTNADRLERLENQNIVIYGQIQEDIGGALFLIEETGQKDLGDVLVLNQSGRNFSIPVEAEIPIWAVGSVEPLAIAELDNLDSIELESYEGQLAVHADRITLAPSPEELAANAEAFYNQEITVYGEVEQVDAENTFILKDPNLFGGGGIIVIQTGEATSESVADDAEIAVSGILRPYIIADLQEEYELTWNLDIQEQLEADFQSAPVLVTDLISLDAEDTAEDAE